MDLLLVETKGGEAYVWLDVVFLWGFASRVRFGGVIVAGL